MSRWDSEWRGYRGGQNTALVILDLDDLSETHLPNERTTDIQPTWLDDTIYFLSDRDWASNVWSYNANTGALNQLTFVTGADIKYLSAGAGQLVYEHDGWIHTLDPTSGESQRVDINVTGDFPWTATRWEDVSGSTVATASLSPTGQRALMEVRGEIWTVPADDGDSRNLSKSSGAADRAPVWSPNGDQIAWFSSDGGQYELLIANQDGMSDPRRISIGESKMGWSPAWSPDGSRIAFIDDDGRVRVVEVESGDITTAGLTGTILDQLFFARTGPQWSPDSKYLAFLKLHPNQFHRIAIWSVENGEVNDITDPLADVLSPAWDRDGRHLYFMASTNLALQSGWINLSSLSAQPTYQPYVMVLRDDDPTPFPIESDEEPVDSEQDEGHDDEEGEDSEDPEGVEVRIDLDGIERRIVALSMPARSYTSMIAGPSGSVFIAEAIPNTPGTTLHKFTLDDAEATEFATSINQAAVSHDGSKILLQSGSNWRIVDTGSPPNGADGSINLALRMQLDRREEWRQMFDETWRYHHEYFYDPGMHGNDWDAVRDRYRPLVEHVQHRADLNYVLDIVNGELSVGHSFVGGGDMPPVDTSRVGLLGADLVANNGRWQIERIYTLESWNPGLSAPLDQPGLRVEEGDYLLAVNGVPLSSSDDPYRLLDGTVGRQTVLRFGDNPSNDDSWTETVVPIQSEFGLRTRAWVEDNRRRVDELSNGTLAYVWVPNTGGGGYTSFNRYFFAQQDKLGAVIDERWNGGGFADDYMVDYMSHQLRGAVTNEAEGGLPYRLPAGVLGPKVLLINERAGSGGDYFPWSFRELGLGPLIGTRTWGGLVANAAPYLLIDGGRVTSPFPGVFDPNNNRWLAENEGVPPDIEVFNDAASVAAGGDPQLERAVEEALRLVEEAGDQTVEVPEFSRPSRRP